MAHAYSLAQLAWLRFKEDNKKREKRKEKWDFARTVGAHPAFGARDGRRRVGGRIAKVRAIINEGMAERERVCLRES